jgi:hypothetical protein
MNWEYRTARFETHGMSGGILEPEEFDAVLNQLGQDGWELVSVFETIHRGGTTRFVFATFKRPSR